MKLKEVLQIGRAQTFAADWLLVIVPFLAGRSDISQAALLTVILWFGHILTFGHNSLMDSCTVAKIGDLPYDAKDPNKAHHPLIRGTVSLHVTKLVIFSGLCCLGLMGIIFTWLFAANIPLALTFYFLYFLFGIAYNEGLSKETPFSFIPITICFSGLAGWGWFLSHGNLGVIGLLYILNVAFIQLFEIGFEGNLKELQVAGRVERRNWLNVLGARIEDGCFIPSFLSTVYGVLTKVGNIMAVAEVYYFMSSPSRLIWFIIVITIIVYLLNELLKPRKYNRKRELLTMSLMEIVSIYAIIPILLDWAIAGALMFLGVIYFFLINIWLWEKPFPLV